MMGSTDIVVIGAGVIGSSIAYKLAQRGLHVAVVDAGGPGSGASGSCDKAIFLQSKRPGVHMEMAVASRRMYAALGDELGANIELKNDGGMVAAGSEAHLEFLRSFVQKQQQAGIAVSLLDGDAARQRQPELSSHILGATWSPDDAEVNPLALNAAYFRAAVKAGAKAWTHTKVIGVNSSLGRVTSVETSRGRIPTGMVVNAAGPFAAEVGRLAGVNVPVQPRRGSILITEAVAPMVHGNVLDAQYITSKHLNAERDGAATPYGVGLSLGQTTSGNLLIGGSREFTGFNKPTDHKVIAEIANHAARIVPALASIRVIRTMTGFRPYTGDGLPIIDRARELEGYVIAAGHEGDGIALAPVTGQLVCDLLDGPGATNYFLPALTIDRFPERARATCPD